MEYKTLEDKSRHSLSHILAHAVLNLYKNVKFGIGPAIENGFYYDFDLEEKLNEDDFEKISNEMRKILAKKLNFERSVISREIALKTFADQPYKIELINDLPEDVEISTYKVGDFLDLCSGPHVENTQYLLGWDFKIYSVTGAYWKGNSENKMMQRIYVYAFPNKTELKEHLTMLEEAKQRDHRILGPQLDLFFIDDTAPGMPYWLANGLKMLNVLLDFWRKEHEKRGYQEVSTPLINSNSLWLTSGHWNHYKENMFIIPLDENRTFAVKPMNCPNAMKIFQRKTMSYRDLPLRMSDCDVLHRNESSGTLHGLLRVQSFRQDDAHIFLKEDQIFNEINEILDIADLFYGIFGLKYKPMLSTRPSDFMGEISVWDKAEDELRQILDTRYGRENYVVNEGDGAFYGPKIDIMMEDALKRTWQMGTIQLDFQLPRNFDLLYTDSDGKRKTPVVVHRVVYGSLERFMGIIIEHFAGKFPFWISPVQVAVIPVSEQSNDYAQSIYNELQQNGIRCVVNLQDDTMGSKIKLYRNQKVPYMILVGEQEQSENLISLNIRGGKKENMIPLKTFMDECKKMNKEMTLNLTENFK